MKQENNIVYKEFVTSFQEQIKKIPYTVEGFKLIDRIEEIYARAITEYHLKHTKNNLLHCMTFDIKALELYSHREKGRFLCYWNDLKEKRKKEQKKLDGV